MSSSTTSTVSIFRWNDMPLERVNDLFERRYIVGERMMLCHIYLKKGSIVPRHQHDNEQLTSILEGKLRFWIGEDEKKVVDLGVGEVMLIPSWVWHKAEALEDTLDMDIFCPPRADWISKTDEYLRKK